MRVLVDVSGYLYKFISGNFKETFLANLKAIFPEND